MDLDLLIRAHDIGRAVEALSAAGFRRTLAEPRPGFDRRFDKGMTLIAPARYELDLHRTLVLGPWGVVLDPERLWDEGQGLSLGGASLRALSRPHRFVHACYHAALGNWPLRLGSLRDVAEMLRGWEGAAATVRPIAARWGVEAVVAAAVADTYRLLGLGTPNDLARWAADYVPTRRHEEWLRLHTRSDKTFSAQALATLRVLPRWRDRAAYVRALALPDPRYTSGRHSSVLGRFAYAVPRSPPRLEGLVLTPAPTPATRLFGDDASTSNPAVDDIVHPDPGHPIKERACAYSSPAGPGSSAPPSSAEP